MSSFKISEELSVYHFEEMAPIQAKDFPFDINWKIVFENSLDFYHVAHAHASTVGAHVRNAPTFETLGNHNLQTLFIAPYHGVLSSTIALLEEGSLRRARNKAFISTLSFPMLF